MKYCPSCFSRKIKKIGMTKEFDFKEGDKEVPLYKCRNCGALWK